jgi:hypothetical protein
VQLIGYQWLVIVLFDLLLRILFFFAGMHILGIPFALVISAMHLVVLFLVTEVVRTLEARAKILTIASLLIANALFTTAFILSWIYFITTGHQTSCTGVEHRCDWIAGKITWFGVQTMMNHVVIQLIINLVPILLAYLIRSANDRRAARQ